MVRIGSRNDWAYTFNSYMAVFIHRKLQSKNSSKFLVLGNKYDDLLQRMHRHIIQQNLLTDDEM